jgi:hypothetical protein
MWWLVMLLGGRIAVEESDGILLDTEANQQHLEQAIPDLAAIGSE